MQLVQFRLKAQSQLHFFFLILVTLFHIVLKLLTLDLLILVFILEIIQ